MATNSDNPAVATPHADTALSTATGLPTLRILVQQADFVLADEYQLLAQTPYCGAVVTFVGLVRDHPDNSLLALQLEHYPGMTERLLTQLAQQAVGRFGLQAVTIIHRVGELTPMAQIVLVAVASPHRAAAFAGAEFIMDYLKTAAPIWKKQRDADGEQWLDAKDSDQQRSARWQQN